MKPNIRIMDTSAIAPQIKTIEIKPYSHRVFYPQGTVVQSPERREQNRAFCISGLIWKHIPSFDVLVKSRLEGARL